MLQVQIDVWLSGIETDETIFFERFLDTKAFDNKNSSLLATALSKMMKETSCDAVYLSIMRHIALLPKNNFERLKTMLIIDKVIQQIILQRSGEDPDPAAVLTNIDILSILNKLDNHDVLKELEARFTVQNDSIKKLEDEIDRLKKSGTGVKGRAGTIVRIFIPHLF